MTHDECLQELVRLDNEYNQACNNLKNELFDNKNRVLNQWAADNSPFKKGDIIEANGEIIKIDSIFGRKSSYYDNKLYGGLYVMYRGRQLTKRLEPRKDENRMSIYDDGREIKLLKPAQNV